MTREEIIAMAKEAGARSEHWATRLFPAAQFLFTPDELAIFAALVAAKERERLFGKAQHDGEMRLMLHRWEDGKCFAAAAHFSAKQTHFGPDDLLQMAVERLDDSLDESIAAAIRARGQKDGA